MNGNVAASAIPAIGEVNFGIQWFKKHPIIGSVAVAAATAVSVYKLISNQESTEEEVLNRDISWSDEHGGSLIEVLGKDMEEEERLEDAMNGMPGRLGGLGLASDPSLHSKKSRQSFVRHRRTALMEGVDDSILETARGSPDDSGSTGTEERRMDYETVSPQWGWYVSITPPPHEQYQQSSLCNSSYYSTVGITPHLSPFAPQASG